SACRIAAYCSCVYVLLWLLRMALAASPGASETSTNVSAVTTNSSATEDSSQRSADRIIEGHLLPGARAGGDVPPAAGSWTPAAGALSAGSRCHSMIRSAL